MLHVQHKGPGHHCGAFVTTFYCLEIINHKCNCKACHFNGWSLAPLFHQWVKVLGVLEIGIMCCTISSTWLVMNCKYPNYSYFTVIPIDVSGKPYSKPSPLPECLSRHQGELVGIRLFWVFELAILGKPSSPWCHLVGALTVSNQSVTQISNRGGFWQSSHVACA